MTRPRSFSSLIRDAAGQLTQAGVETARLDARLLMAAAADAELADLISRDADDPGAEIAVRFHAMIARRAQREPVARIAGRRAFWDLDLRVTPDVLDPRPETEGVVEASLGRMPESAPIRVFDVGVGSGAILLAILNARPHAFGVGSDVSAGAVATAAENAARLGLSDRTGFFVGDWLEPMAGRADLIVSNPPYIETDEIAQLAPEVRDYDPRQALDGGADGLAAYRYLAAQAPGKLKPGGWLIVEVGAGQARAVQSLFADAEFQELFCDQDLSGRDRVVGGRLADGPDVETHANA